MNRDVHGDGNGKHGMKKGRKGKEGEER